MFNHENGGYSLADIAAATGANRNNTGFGGDNGWWIIIILLLCFGGWDNNGFGPAANRGNGGSTKVGYFPPAATERDVRDAVDQQTLISKLDQQTYGLADSTYALTSSITNGFSGVDKAINGLGYQTQAGFTSIGNMIASQGCDTRAAIKDVSTQSLMNTNAIQQQISSCCCDLEKANMQNRFDAQNYNCNTLQAIDKLGDRIIDYMTQDKIATLTAENQNLKFAASQSAQNAFFTANQEAQTAELIRRLAPPVAQPAYIVPNPNCCYNPSLGSACGCAGAF